jgi:hypothetical protein
MISESETTATSQSSKNESTNGGHNSRANTQSNNSNQDTVFIPPKTPVRSKTRDTQYNTPLKLVTKSGHLVYTYIKNFFF